MHRSNHTLFNLENCITLENRLPLTFVPKQFSTYFINSKRRFFLYFKYKDQMNQVIRIFEKQNVRFHQRKSIFPDRQEQQEIVFHCNYKYKKKDLRWSLGRDTRIREPVNKFNVKRNQNAKNTLNESKQSIIQQLTSKSNSSNKEIVGQKPQIQHKDPIQMQIEQTEAEFVADFGEIKIKNPQVLDLVNNIEFIKALFKLQKSKSFYEKNHQ